jgi:o-succinylbenzoate synthase
MTYRFQFRRYKLRFRRPIRTAHGLWTEREGIIVRLQDESGHASYGEAAPIPHFVAETVDEIEAACVGLGENVDDARLGNVSGDLGCLRNALAAAQPSKIKTVQKHLAIAALVPAGSAAINEVQAKAESGFRVFKWKVGVGDVADEIALLDDVCSVLPSGGKLRLDANGAWDRRQAERWLERCAERPVEFVEQPCFAAKVERAAQRAKVEDLLLGLASEYPTPIGLDESIAGGDDIEHWLEKGWPGIFVIKPALLADVAGTMAKLAKAKADVVFSSALETGVGAKSALLAAFAWTGHSTTVAAPPRALGFGVWPLFENGTFNGPAAAPYLRSEDVERLDAEAAWNALAPAHA